jgi:hypothetical protein
MTTAKQEVSMVDLVNTNGRGPVGTATNSPISDAGTMSRTQNRPNVSHGTSLDANGPGSAGSSGLTDADRDFIREIHQARHLDGTPFRLDELMFMRAENARMQQQAMREFGPGSKSVAWFQEVIAAYDEEIEKAKSPLGSAVNALQKVLADPSAKEKDMSEKLVVMIGVMRQEQLTGQDDPIAEEATKLIVQVIDRSTDQRNAALEDLIKKEKSASGTISDDKFREAVAAVMGGERQRQLTGMSEDKEGEKKSERARKAVDEVIHLVSERRLKSLKTLIDQEEKSMGSVPDQKFKDMIAAVIGDERQKVLMGISDDGSAGMKPVLDVMRLVLKRRQAAVADLFKKQMIPGGGVTNDQVNKAIKDLEVIKAEARQLGIAVPEGDFTLGTPQFSKE